LIRIFIGFDPDEIVAYHVLSNSIIRNATCPVSITPLSRKNLAGAFNRPRGELDSTDFSTSRFLVPYLSDYEGWSVFMDCDMLCVGDVAELARFMSLDSRWTKAVFCVQHKYAPKMEDKFLGNVQTAYEKKNWSSVMIFNNAMCRELTVDAVNTKPGLWLHQFGWCHPEQIGALPAGWNYLVGEENQDKEKLRLIHYTRGTPCFLESKDCEFSGLWHVEKTDMTSHG
jgi:hypothetical protein